MVQTRRQAAAQAANASQRPARRPRVFASAPNYVPRSSTEGRYTCNACRKIFTRPKSVKDHFEGRAGNPLRSRRCPGPITAGMAWDDHPSCKKVNGRWQPNVMPGVPVPVPVMTAAAAASASTGTGAGAGTGASAIAAGDDDEDDDEENWDDDEDEDKEGGEEESEEEEKEDDDEEGDENDDDDDEVEEEEEGEEVEDGGDDDTEMMEGGDENGAELGGYVPDTPDPSTVYSPVISTLSSDSDDESGGAQVAAVESSVGAGLGVGAAGGQGTGQLAAMAANLLGARSPQWYNDLTDIVWGEDILEDWS